MKTLDLRFYSEKQKDINILRYNSARNVENSRGVVNQPNKNSCYASDHSDNVEAIIELYKY
jgi:hypothetical protein